MGLIKYHKDYSCDLVHLNEMDRRNCFRKSHTHIVNAVLKISMGSTYIYAYYITFYFIEQRNSYMSVMNIASYIVNMSINEKKNSDKGNVLSTNRRTHHTKIISNYG